MRHRLLLHAQHEASSAVFGLSGAWQLPEHYGAPAAEEEALAAGVGVLDRSDTGALELTGADRATFLQGLCTNDVVGLEAGRGLLAAHLNVKARVQMLLAVLALPDRLRLLLPPGAAPGLLAKLDGFLIMERVELADVSGQDVALSLLGPRAVELTAFLTGLDRTELAALSIGPGFGIREAAVGDVPVRLVGWDDAGPGLQLWAGASAALALWQAVLAAGTSFGLQVVGRRAAEVARIRAGRPAFGQEATEDTFLPELPMEPLVSWTKGCYLGQEPVARTHYRGRANRGLAGLLLAGGAPAPTPGETLWQAEREVGTITSAAFSQRLGRGVALAFIRREALEPGTALVARGAGGEAQAFVVPFPIDLPLAAEEPR